MDEEKSNDNRLIGALLYKEDGNYFIQYPDKKMSIFPDWNSLEQEMNKVGGEL